MRTGVLRDALFLAREDAWRLFRLRETWMWTFLMPVVFFYFLGLANNGGSPDSKDDLAVSVAPDAGFLADQLIARLGKRDYRIVRPDTRQKFLASQRRLEIPAGFTQSVLDGKPVKVSFSRTGEDPGADYDRVRLTRAVYTVLADLTVIERPGGVATPEDFERLAAEPRTLTLDVKPAGKRIVPPTGYEQSVPGSMVMFTLTVLFTVGGVSLTIERNHGILRRLASSPMTRGAVVLGKWGARMAIGAVQIVFAMIAGSVLFRVHWGPNLPAVVAVLMAYGGLAAAMGMLLGNFARTDAQAIGLGIIASNLLAGLGGCWWPIEITPLWTQRLALAFPTGWAMDALHKLVSFRDSPVSVLPHFCAMVAAALAAGYAISRKFRFQ